MKRPSAIRAGLDGEKPDPVIGSLSAKDLERQQFYDVRSSPSYFIDGEASGGGGADAARMLFESKIDPMIANHMVEAPEAAIALTAQAAGSTVKVKTTVSQVARTSDKLRLQIALVERHVRYSGENGTRFHDMVVRTMASPPAPAGKKAEAGEAAAGTPGTMLPPTFTDALTLVICYPFGRSPRSPKR